MKLSKHSGTTVRDSLKPSTSASFTQAISWSATCSVRADDGRLAAAEHEPVDQLAPGPARAERGGNSLYIGANRLSGTRLVAAEIDTKRGSGVCQGTFDTGVAPILRQKLADILFGAGVDEHALGVAGGEYAATIGGARRTAPAYAAAMAPTAARRRHETAFRGGAPGAPGVDRCRCPGCDRALPRRLPSHPPTARRPLEGIRPPGRTGRHAPSAHRSPWRAALSR